MIGKQLKEALRMLEESKYIVGNLQIDEYDAKCSNYMQKCREIQVKRFVSVERIDICLNALKHIASTDGKCGEGKHY